MANVLGKFYSGVKLRKGATPESPTELIGVQPYPLNPPTSGGGGNGIGITLNAKVIGGVKRYIETSDILRIPEHYEYNLYRLNIDGLVINNGVINII